MRPRGVVCVVAGAVVFASVAGDRGVGGHATAWADGTPVVRTDDDMPELPLDSYEFDGADDKAYDRMESATRLLTQRCMVRHGFADFPRDPRFPEMSTTFRTVMVAVGTGPVGPYDLEEARRWGYGRDPRKKILPRVPEGREMTAEESAVYFGDRRDEHGGGCCEEASRRLRHGLRDTERMWTYVADREAALRRRAEREPRLRRAYKAWADCVVDKGYKRYADPMDAFDDKAWGRGQDGNTTRTKQELGVAVADIECKRAHNTGGVWWSVTERLQRRELEQRRAEFEAVRKDRDQLLARSRAVLETARSR